MYIVFDGMGAAVLVKRLFLHEVVTVTHRLTSLTN